MAILVSSQDCYGELYAELLSVEPIVVSSDDDADVVPGSIHGGEVVGEGVARGDDARQLLGDGQVLADRILEDAGSAHGNALAVDGDVAPSDTHGGGDSASAGSGGDAGSYDAVAHGPGEGARMEVHDPIEHSPLAGAAPLHRARTPRATKWGRCLACAAPLRVRFVDARRSRPFLACCTYQASNPFCCRYTTPFPAERVHELPQRVLVRRRTDA